MDMDIDIDKSEDELELERLVFGDADGIKQRLKGGKDIEHAIQKTDLEHLENDQLFFIDSGDPNLEIEQRSGDEDEPIDSGAAWYDSDDEILTISLANSTQNRKLRKAEDEDTVNGKVYTLRLRQQFERIYPVPEWASVSAAKRQRNSESDDEDNFVQTDPLSILFQTSAPLTQRPTTHLPDDILYMAAVAPVPQPNSSPLPRTLHFHPSHPLILIGSQDHTLRIHSIDGKHNPLATSLKLSRLRIQSALFHPTKNLVYATGLRRPGIIIWDLNSGAVRKIARSSNEEAMSSGEWSNLRISPNGSVVGILGAATRWVCLLSAETGQYLGGCKVDGRIADYLFTRDGNGAIIITVSGEVWEFDTTSLLVTNRWRDEGGVSLTKVALTPDNKFLAIGSTSGIVTIYDLTLCPRSPVKTLYNLTTPITSLAFSPDGQILVMASSGKRDQLRVVHIPSLKVFPNWPTSKTPLGVIECLDVGDNGYLAVGRKKGVALWKIRD